MHILRLYTATVFISICLGAVAIMKNPRQTDGRTVIPIYLQIFVCML